MSIFTNIKQKIIGEKLDPHDPKIHQTVTLMAFLAWVGLGSDGLSSSCYGPQEIMVSLANHPHLSILIGIASVITIFIISSSYSQIIDLFPSGGGGYYVATKLLNPTLGVISGSALLIDYVLTITVSIASGADALFSFLPKELLPAKMIFAVFMVFLLIVLNMRGVKESVGPLVPIFLVFIVSHVFIIVYAIIVHSSTFPEVYNATINEYNSSISEVGFFGTFFILMHAYSVGAGTYTGIEAVSNGLPILREPKVQTAKKTMKYMTFSLAITVFGLLLAYLLFNVQYTHGKTLNAVLFENATSNWNPTVSYTFIIITLISEAAILFVAAQTGFLGGPRVLANMALDRWVPNRFAALSDRLVTQKGVLLMGVFAGILMVATNGSVAFLVVLYSINVFITFSLSQLGMVKYWWQSRKTEKSWKKKILINGIGLILCTFILFAVTIVKFFEGGWITILITGSLVSVVMFINKEYRNAGKLLKKLDTLTEDIDFSSPDVIVDGNSSKHKFDPNGRTAVLLVNGFSGVGIHSLLSIFRLFGDTFKNFVFIQVGIIDAGVFQGHEEVDQLKLKINDDVTKYIKFMNEHGYFAESISSTGLDIVDEIMKLVPEIKKRYSKVVFFGGQLVFPKDTFLTRLLHNYTVFTVQRKLYSEGIEFVILPIKLR
jgi:amino acid transporter